MRAVNPKALVAWLMSISLLPTIAWVVNPAPLVSSLRFGRARAPPAAMPRFRRQRRDCGYWNPAGPPSSSAPISR